MRFVVYSDYLCPWCYNAAVRLGRLEAEFGGQVELEWRPYLLRPRPAASRDLEKFRAYTRSWMRPAAEPESGEFRIWEGDTPPPTHSIPPHCLAKAAAECSPEAFRDIHARLLQAYFLHNRDISAEATLRALWSEAGLKPAAFERSLDPELAREVVEQYSEAQELGVTGVPAMRLQGNDAVVVGAQPYELYERWVTRTLERMAAVDEGDAGSDLAPD